MSINPYTRTFFTKFMIETKNYYLNLRSPVIQFFLMSAFAFAGL